MNSYITLIIVIVTLIGFTSSSINALNYSVCEESKSSAKVNNVVVSGCESLANNERCPFHRGFNSTIELSFTTKKRVEQVKVKVNGKLNALPIPFQVNPDKACGNYGFDCPLEADKDYKFKLTMPILRSYPRVNVDVNLRLIDEKNEIVGCIDIPTVIREPVKPANNSTARA